VKSWRDAGDTFAGKTTEKRCNFDPSTPAAGAENLHFTLNGETRRVPGPKEISIYKEEHEKRLDHQQHICGLSA
jgi:hypothetical protein